MHINNYKLLYINIFLSISLLISSILIFKTFNPLIILSLLLLPFLTTYILINNKKISTTLNNKKDSNIESNRIFSEEERTFNTYEDYKENEYSYKEIKFNSKIEKHCKVLKIENSEGLTLKQLKQKYRSLAKKYHPDLVKNEDLKKSYQESMVIINNSYLELKTYLNSKS